MQQSKRAWKDSRCWKNMGVAPLLPKVAPQSLKVAPSRPEIAPQTPKVAHAPQFISRISSRSAKIKHRKFNSRANLQIISPENRSRFYRMATVQANLATLPQFIKPPLLKAPTPGIIIPFPSLPKTSDGC